MRKTISDRELRIVKIKNAKGHVDDEPKKVVSFSVFFRISLFLQLTQGIMQQRVALGDGKS